MLTKFFVDNYKSLVNTTIPKRDVHLAIVPADAGRSQR